MQVVPSWPKGFSSSFATCQRVGDQSALKCLKTVAVISTLVAPRSNTKGFRRGRSTKPEASWSCKGFLSDLSSALGKAMSISPVDQNHLKKLLLETSIGSRPESPTSLWRKKRGHQHHHHHRCHHHHHHQQQQQQEEEEEKDEEEEEKEEEEEEEKEKEEQQQQQQQTRAKNDNMNTRRTRTNQAHLPPDQVRGVHVSVYGFQHLHSRYMSLQRMFGPLYLSCWPCSFWNEVTGYQSVTSHWHWGFSSLM